MENGFKMMSQTADEGRSGGEPSEGSGSEPSGEGRGGVASQLRAYGVDTNQISEAATERASELQELIIDEIRARPMRAIAWAAAAGVIFGFWAAK